MSSVDSQLRWYIIYPNLLSFILVMPTNSIILGITERTHLCIPDNELFDATFCSCCLRREFYLCYLPMKHVMSSTQWSLGMSTTPLSLSATLPSSHSLSTKWLILKLFCNIITFLWGLIKYHSPDKLECFVLLKPRSIIESRFLIAIMFLEDNKVAVVLSVRKMKKHKRIRLCIIGLYTKRCM